MRRFAEEIEGVSITALLVGGGALQRLFDVAPHDELASEYAHALGDGLTDHGIAESGNQAPQNGLHRLILVLVQRNHPAGEHQCPGGGIDEDRVAVTNMLLPVRRPEFVADQAICRCLIGNAQQRFGETHKHDTFLTGKLVFLHEGVDATFADALFSHLANQRAGTGVDAVQGFPVEVRRVQQCFDDVCLIAPVPVGDFAA